MRQKFVKLALAHLPQKPVDLERVFDLIRDLRAFLYLTHDHLDGDHSGGADLHLVDA